MLKTFLKFLKITCNIEKSFGSVFKRNILEVILLKPRPKKTLSLKIFIKKKKKTIPNTF